jgi:DNA-binding NarL/FixJ family response regulator
METTFVFSDFQPAQACRKRGSPGWYKTKLGSCGLVHNTDSTGLTDTDYGSLTQREREVMTLVVSGLLNKQVGGELGISEITVKAHRGNVMRKMKAESFVNLINMAMRLRVTRPIATSPAWG